MIGAHEKKKKARERVTFCTSKPTVMHTMVTTVFSPFHNNNRLDKY